MSTISVPANLSGEAELDLLQLPKKPRLKIRSGTVSDIEQIYKLIEMHVPLTVAPPSVMRFVMGINRNNIIVFCRNGEIVGFHAMLMLSTHGLEALLTGELTPLDPDPHHLVRRLEAPAAIYQWLTVGPGMAAEGVLHVSHFLQGPFYRHANLYSRSITPTGARIAMAMGFRPMPNPPMPGLFRYVRLANRLHLPAAA